MVYKNIRIIFLLIIVTVWIAVFSIDSNLHIVACDVGQGDAILIYKNTTQILIDGGPNKSVLDCLGKYMPFWDKTIELVILTHPQQDHYGGLIDVIKNYKIGLFGEYNTQSSNLSYSVLRNEVGGRGIEGITLTKGMVVRLGLIYLDILHPIGDTNNKNVNDDGIVTLLKYREFKAIFTADVENEVSDGLSELPEIKRLDYIKVNHHGSKNGMSEKLLRAVDPDVAVISVGEKNRYGHPHKEILQMLRSSSAINNTNIKILRTDEIGNVDVVTDGIKFWYNE